MRTIETRPSGAHRWTQCSAAPLFAARAGPQPDNDAAREGTCAAWAADVLLKTGPILKAVDLLNETHPNGWKIDLEMCGHVQSYVDMIRAEGGLISSERYVALSSRVAGTLDSSASMVDGTLRVRDFKYGYRLIEPDSPQLVIYAGALMAETQGVTEIWTEIYQPRGFHPEGIHRCRHWTPAELTERCEWIIERAELCHQPEPPATPGPHCEYCEGATGCAALHATAKTLYAIVSDTRHREMTASELAEELTFLTQAEKIIKAAKSAIDAEAMARVKAGERLPGYGVNERRGHRKFTVTDRTIQAITGIDPYTRKLMTPPELKAEATSKGVKTSVIDRQLKTLTERPVIGHKLERLNPKDLEREFKR